MTAAEGRILAQYTVKPWFIWRIPFCAGESRAPSDVSCSMYCDYFILFFSKLSVQGKYQISREFGRYVQGIIGFRLATLLVIPLQSVNCPHRSQCLGILLELLYIMPMVITNMPILCQWSKMWPTCPKSFMVCAIFQMIESFSFVIFTWTANGKSQKCHVIPRLP